MYGLLQLFFNLKLLESRGILKQTKIHYGTMKKKRTKNLSAMQSKMLVEINTSFHHIFT